MRNIIKQMLRENKEEKILKYLKKNYEGKVEEVDGFRFTFEIIRGKDVYKRAMYGIRAYSVDYEELKHNYKLDVVGFRYFLVPKDYERARDGDILSNSLASSLEKNRSEYDTDEIIFKYLYGEAAKTKLHSLAFKRKFQDLEEYLNIDIILNYWGFKEDENLQESVDNKEKFLKNKFGGKIIEYDGFRFKSDVVKVGVTYLVKFFLLKDKSLVNNLHVIKTPVGGGYNATMLKRGPNKEKIKSLQSISYRCPDTKDDDNIMFNLLIRAGRVIFDDYIKKDVDAYAYYLSAEVKSQFAGVVTSSPDLQEQTDPDKRLKLFRIAELCRERYKGKVVRSTMGTYRNYKITNVNLDKEMDFYVRFDAEPVKGSEYTKNAHDYTVKDLCNEVRDYYSMRAKVRVHDSGNHYW
jgi:hypothetical protein